MARFNKTSSIPPPVSKALQDLSGRRGVEATLILSRKDGSIISADGLLSNERGKGTDQRGSWRIQETSEQGTATNDTPSTANGEAKGLGATEDPGKAQQTGVESIATAIYDYMSAASSLSSAFEAVVPPRSAQADFARNYGGGGYMAAQQISGTQQATDEDEMPDELQLLRLRTRKYEIIIFPDSKFLCCVVQDIAKSTQVNGNGRHGGGIGGLRI